MFTFDFDPWDRYEFGNWQGNVANRVDFKWTGNSFIPFLNEGVLMTNVRWRYEGPSDHGPTARAAYPTKGTEKGKELGE